jgi:hypothetical protein
MIGLAERVLLIILLSTCERILSKGHQSKVHDYRDGCGHGNAPLNIGDPRGANAREKMRGPSLISRGSAIKVSDTKNDIENAIARWTKRLAIFTAALAAFTLITALASIYQSVVLSGQLREMQGASADMKTSIEATNRLGDATVRSNIEAHRLADEAKRATDNAIRTAEFQLRAYVGIVDNNVLTCSTCDTLDANNKTDIKAEYIYDNRIVLNLQNTGQTPAYNVHSEGSFWWGDFGQRIPKDFKYPIITVTKGVPVESSIATLGRGEKVPVVSMIDVSVISSIVSARKHVMSLYYYGYIYYEDIFHTQRETPFCFEYLPDYPGDEQFIDCPEHNTPDQGK